MKKVIYNTLFVSLLVASLTSCMNNGDDDNFDAVAQLEADIAAIDAHIAANPATYEEIEYTITVDGVEETKNRRWINLENGVRIFVTEERSGAEKPALGDQITTHYTGRFLSGTVFDSSNPGTGNPFRFSLGGGVIAGWNIAFSELTVGTRAILLIPSQFAYGRQGSSSIPPNTPLRFEVNFISKSSSNI